MYGIERYKTIVTDFDFIKTKVTQKLEGSKSRTLSATGKTILTKSNLTGMSL